MLESSEGHIYYMIIINLLKANHNTNRLLQVRRKKQENKASVKKAPKVEESSDEYKYQRNLRSRKEKKVNVVKGEKCTTCKKRVIKILDIERRGYGLMHNLPEILPHSVFGSEKLTRRMVL